MSKYKPTLLLAIKMWNFILFWCDYLSSFYTVIICVQYSSSARVTTRNYFESALTVFEILDITKYFAKCYFFLHKFISRQLFILPKIFAPTKVLHTACTPTELKQNLLLWPFFASFVKLLNIRLDECSLLLSHLKSVFLKTVRARVREGAKLYQCFSPGGS